MDYAELIQYETAEEFLADLREDGARVRRQTVRSRVSHLFPDDDCTDYWEVFVTWTCVYQWDGGCTLAELTQRVGEMQKGDRRAAKLGEQLEEVCRLHDLGIRPGKIELP